MVLNLRRLAPSSITPGSLDVKPTTNLSTLPDVQFAQSRVTYPALMEMGAPLRLDGDEEEMDMEPQDMVTTEAEEKDQPEEVQLEGPSLTA